MNHEDGVRVANCPIQQDYCHGSCYWRREDRCLKRGTKVTDLDPRPSLLIRVLTFLEIIPLKLFLKQWCSLLRKLKKIEEVRELKAHFNKRLFYFIVALVLILTPALVPSESPLRIGTMVAGGVLLGASLVLLVSDYTRPSNRTPQPIVKVKFSSVDEFLAELLTDGARGEIRDNIVRATGQYTSAGPVPLKHLSLVASYSSADGRIVELHRYCGDVWPAPDGVTAHSQELYDGSLKKITEFCERHHIDCRAGIQELVTPPTT